MAFLETQNLTFSYPAEEGQLAEPVLQEVSLAIPEGQFVALLGHNGCGKSTLAKQFNAMLLPSGGTVYVDGMTTADEALTFEIRQRVGLVLQNPDNQLVASVVEEDVAFGPENLGVPPKEIRRRVDAALRDVDMYEYRHSTHKLSGGQKQRVAIAGVLAMRPKCVVLDEPTAMLDPVGRNEVVSTIHELNEKFGVTVVLITHHMREATEADRVVVMNDGKIIADDTPKKVFSQVELLRDVGLTVPETTDLLYELNERGWNLPLDALSVEECARAIYQEAANA